MAKSQDEHDAAFKAAVEAAVKKGKRIEGMTAEESRKELDNAVARLREMEGGYNFEGRLLLGAMAGHIADMAMMLRKLLERG